MIKEKNKNGGVKNLNNKVRNQNGEITTENTEVQKVMRDHCKQLYVPKMGNFEEMGKILRKA